MLKLNNQKIRYLPIRPNHIDDGRIACPHCRRRIVPYVYFEYGVAMHSSCRLCGGTVQVFRRPGKKLTLVGLVVRIALGWLGFAILYVITFS